MHSKPGRELVIVSNRLPVRLVGDAAESQFEPSDGGLVSALSGLQEVGAWVGWPGAVVADEHQAHVAESLLGQGFHPVFLDQQDVEGHYDAICNETLWPLFHYFVGRMSVHAEAWERHVAVNRRFADTVCRIAGPEARVWVHDFHLMLVPAMLREARPDLTIGFFLHIPFPSSEIYRALPAREAILNGLLSADYVAFQSGDDRRHFRSACLRVLGLESGNESLEIDNRRVGLGVEPIGIDVDGFRATAADAETASALAEIEHRYEGRTLVLGVERLDYTKGIEQKLRAFERFLERNPERVSTTTLLQVVVPSRLDSEQYRAERDEIQNLVATINGRFGEPGLTSVEYLHRSIPRPELVALYRRADALLVNSLRDGMNLVAQEFAFCQAVEGLPRRWNGALLLSELTGAAKVLPGAILVNPWDSDGLAERLADALELDPVERRRRIETMSERVDELDCRRWAARFLANLDASVRLRPGAAPARLQPEEQHALARQLGQARRRTILLDYDGTLREIVAHPRLAAPTPEISTLLRDLAALPRTDVHLISGRDRATLEEWFGGLPIAISAEHGFVSRRPGEAWVELADIDLSWLPEFEQHLRDVALDVPGTFVERKPSSVAWHYRQAEPEYASWRAREMLGSLDQLLGGVAAEVTRGHQVIEVRPLGVNKGAYASRLFEHGLARGHAVLALGDDRTDRDLYAALPNGAIAIHVGRTQPPGLVNHHHLLADPAAARGFLREVADQTTRSSFGASKAPGIAVN